MNKQLEKYARDTLKTGLSLCTDAQQLFFKRMYSYKNLEFSINEVVDTMDSDKLDWAMSQVQRTLDKSCKG